MATPKWAVLSISQAVRFILLKKILATILNIMRSNFQGNQALYSGGALYMVSFNDVKIGQTSVFLNNFANEDGSDIFA
jgi:predicted outer membrane repeat protein